MSVELVEQLKTVLVQERLQTCNDIHSFLKKKNVDDKILSFIKEFKNLTINEIENDKSINNNIILDNGTNNSNEITPKQSQKHGFTIENEIRTKVFNLEKKSNDTNTHDIPKKLNKFNSNENISIKSTQSNNVDCGKKYYYRC